jgi:uncharacterized RmlC-like cupin family protein
MNRKELPRQACGAKVLSPYESTIEIGAQAQRLCHVLSKKTVDCRHISAGLIVMPPHKVARPHLHQAHEMVLFIVEGWGAALVGPTLAPIYHGPGDFIYIPAGVEHLGINLSRTDRIVIAEIRTDPYFNADVVLLPALEEKAQQIAADLRTQFATGEILPEAKTESAGPFKY